MYGYGAASPPLHHMNNPFANSNDPSHASSRFPALTSSPGLDLSQQQQQYSQWPNTSSISGGYGQQQAYGYAQQQPSGFVGSPQYTPSSPSQFQPTSSFGQQLSANVHGSSYGYLSGQPTGLPQQQQQAPLGPAQQQISNNPGYVAQFDPYGSLSQWDGSSQHQQQQQQQYQQYQQYQQFPQQQYGNTNYGSQIMSPGPTTASDGVSPTGDLHPREHLRTHKAEIEGWNSAGWKNFFKTFDALGNAWNARKTACGPQLEQLKAQLPYAGLYQQQVQSQLTMVQQMQREAENNYDAVTAAKYQLEEVFHGYRQSGDAASKRRVREATNSAMNSLPPWPPASL